MSVAEAPSQCTSTAAYCFSWQWYGDSTWQCGYMTTRLVTDIALGSSGVTGGRSGDGGSMQRGCSRLIGSVALGIWEGTGEMEGGGGRTGASTA